MIALSDLELNIMPVEEALSNANMQKEWQ